ncbi:MAG: serine/threonine-protein kinase, partial [Planctomycetota bacterium]
MFESNSRSGGPDGSGAGRDGSGGDSSGSGGPNRDGSRRGGSGRDRSPRGGSGRGGNSASGGSTNRNGSSDGGTHGDDQSDGALPAGSTHQNPGSPFSAAPNSSTLHTSPRDGRKSDDAGDATDPTRAFGNSDNALPAGEVAPNAITRGNSADNAAEISESPNLIGYDKVPDQIADFKIIRVLGEGSFGTVLKAQDMALGRMVAIKVPLIGKKVHPAKLRTFHDEARRSAAIKNAAIVEIYQVNRDRGIPYIVMEYVEGPTLEEFLKSGQWTLAQAISILQPLAKGLAYAHAAGIVHRDFKPSNILLQGPRAKLADFSLARKLRTGSRLRTTYVSTRWYRAPEIML